MDKYQDVRNIPLKSVLAEFGLHGFQETCRETGVVRALSVPQSKEKQNLVQL